MSYTEGRPYTLEEKEFCEYLRKEKSLADEAGIEIWQVHGPWRWPQDATEEDRAERLEKMSRSIRGAAILGAKYWVVHPIMPFDTDDILKDKYAETHALNLEFFRKLLPVARQEGVIICLENMPFLAYTHSAPEEIVKLIREIDDPYLKMCLDTGHANMNSDWRSPAQSIREYADLIKVLHVHDNKGDRDAHLLPFYGTIDWEDFSKALHETNFDGVLSLETIPSADLPKDIYEDSFSLYYRVAKGIENLYKKA